jgi:hypothetical protein
MTVESALWAQLLVTSLYDCWNTGRVFFPTLLVLLSSALPLSLFLLLLLLLRTEAATHCTLFQQAMVSPSSD